MITFSDRFSVYIEDIFKTSIKQAVRKELCKWDIRYLLCIKISCESMVISEFKLFIKQIQNFKNV